MAQISAKTIGMRFKWRVLVTWALSLTESISLLLFPLFIGFAINDMLVGMYDGLWQLAGLGAISLIIGSIRRYYDTRVYSSIYRQIAAELVDRETAHNSSPSKINARATLLNEFTEFLENSFPEMLTGIIGLVGTLIILFGLNQDVFVAALMAFGWTVVVYSVTTKRNIRLNKYYNDTLEVQVDELSKPEPAPRRFFKRLMKWNIKLSDLETTNFSLVWMAMISLLVFSIFSAASVEAEYGTIFSLIMYVFDFSESSMSLPLHYQEYLRLQEISGRLSDSK